MYEMGICIYETENKNFRINPLICINILELT